MSSLLSQLLAKNKSAVGAVVNKESSNDERPQADTQPVQKETTAPTTPVSSPAVPAAGELPNDDGLSASKPQGSAVAKPQASKPSLLNSLVATRDTAEKAKADHDYLFAPIPENFQDVLDNLDGLMKKDQGEIDFHLGHIRNYVQRIMVDLRTNPEYDGLIIDRDVHNIMAFLQRTKSQAEITIGNKVEKAAKRAAKPKGSARFDIDLGSLDLGAEQPKSLSDLSNLGEL